MKVKSRGVEPSLNWAGLEYLRCCQCREWGWADAMLIETLEYECCLCRFQTQS